MASLVNGIMNHKILSTPKVPYIIIIDAKTISKANCGEYGCETIKSLHIRFE